MKSSVLKIILATIICIISLSFDPLISYLGGRLDGHLSFFGLPLEIVPFCIFVVYFIKLAKRTLSAFKNNKKIFFQGSIGILMVIISFVMLNKYFTKNYFLLGYRDRIEKTITLEELRKIAIASQKYIITDSLGRKKLPGPGKSSLWKKSKHDSTWQKIINETKLSKLKDSVLIFAGGNSVELSWGGALTGHWGIVIYTETLEKMPENESRLYLSQDIYLYTMAD